MSVYTGSSPALTIATCECRFGRCPRLHGSGTRAETERGAREKRERRAGLAGKKGERARSVHALLDGVVEECGVHGLADYIHTTE